MCHKGRGEVGGGGLVKDLKKIVREIGIQSFIEQEYHITNKTL